MPQKIAPFINDDDFEYIVSEVGRNFTVIPRTATQDVYNQPIYTDGSGCTFIGVVQDLTTKDIQVQPGILQIGDKWLFTENDVVIDVTSRVVIDSIRYKLVEETSETLDTPTAIFKSYVIRKTVV